MGRASTSVNAIREFPKACPEAHLVGESRFCHAGSTTPLTRRTFQWPSAFGNILIPVGEYLVPTLVWAVFEGQKGHRDLQMGK